MPHCRISSGAKLMRAPAGQLAKQLAPVYAGGSGLYCAPEHEEHISWLFVVHVVYEGNTVVEPGEYPHCQFFKSPVKLKGMLTQIPSASFNARHPSESCVQYV
jgi:hypothetical protein